MPLHTFQRKDYGSWQVFQKSYTTTELKVRRAHLAKVANSRIRGLERAKSEISGRALIEGHQYDIVLDYLESRNQKRFSESRTKNFTDTQLRTEITLLESFLAMKTSTVGGARRAETKTAQTFISKGIPEEVAYNADFYEFLSSKTFEELEKNVADSEDIVDLISRASDEGYSIDQILSDFENYKGRTQKGLWGLFGLKPI